MTEEFTKKRESDGEQLWRDERARFELRPSLYANTVRKQNAITLEVSGDYASAFTTMSYESARELAQWILDVTDLQEES